mmetsp:Transcript_71348/g.170848  ORF Transcript_71348/g.170848 Transcript_71348/m.170848 type:complete len:97 (-) Transcript_71348:2778-3068(-)
MDPRCDCAEQTTKGWRLPRWDLGPKASLLPRSEPLLRLMPAGALRSEVGVIVPSWLVPREAAALFASSGTADRCLLSSAAEEGEDDGRPSCRSQAL